MMAAAVEDLEVGNSVEADASAFGARFEREHPGEVCYGIVVGRGEPTTESGTPTWVVRYDGDRGGTVTRAEDLRRSYSTARRLRDAETPPWSAWQFFAAARRHVAQEARGKPNNNVMQVLGEEWRSLSSVEKTRWTSLAADDKVAFVAAGGKIGPTADEALASVDLKCVAEAPLAFTTAVRPGSNNNEAASGRFERYRRATSLREALQLGATKQDLVRDLSRGSLFLEAAADRARHRQIAGPRQRDKGRWRYSSRGGDDDEADFFFGGAFLGTDPRVKRSRKLLKGTGSSAGTPEERPAETLVMPPLSNKNKKKEERSVVVVKRVAAITKDDGGLAARAFPNPNPNSNPNPNPALAARAFAENDGLVESYLLPCLAIGALSKLEGVCRRWRRIVSVHAVASRPWAFLIEHRGTVVLVHAPHSRTCPLARPLVVALPNNKKDASSSSEKEEPSFNLARWEPDIFGEAASVFPSSGFDAVRTLADGGVEADGVRIPHSLRVFKHCCKSTFLADLAELEALVGAREPNTIIPKECLADRPKRAVFLDALSTRGFKQEQLKRKSTKDLVDLMNDYTADAFQHVNDLDHAGCRTVCWGGNDHWQSKKSAVMMGALDPDARVTRNLAAWGVKVPTTTQPDAKRAYLRSILQAHGRLSHYKRVLCCLKDPKTFFTGHRRPDIVSALQSAPPLV